MRQMLGDLYDVSSIILDPTMFGQCVERRRRFFILTLKGQTALTTPMGSIPRCLGRHRGNHTLQDCIIAGPAELAKELSNFCQRPGSLAARHGHTALNPLILGTENAFEKSLAKCDLKNLKSFRAVAPRGRIWGLLTNPLRRNHHSKEDIMYPWAF